MVSLVVLSHSPDIANGIRTLSLEIADEAVIYAVGGSKAGTLGSDFDATLEVLTEAARTGDVIVLTDMGSTRMVAQMALETLEQAEQARIRLSDAALVEGAIIAAVAIGAGLPAPEVLRQLEAFKLNKS